MSWQWTTGSGPDFQNFPKRLIDKKRQQAVQAMKEVIDKAVQDMKDFTSTRPSAKSGKEGRVDTGQMLDAIDGKVFQEGVNTVVGEFGFISQQELYYALQTSTGFQHYLSGEMIEPTFALRDAAIAAIQSLLQKLKE